MLLGKFEDEKLEEEIIEVIDKIILRRYAVCISIVSCPKLCMIDISVRVCSSSEVRIHDKALLYQIAGGSAHLSEAEIESAVSQVVKKTSLQKDLCQEIESIRNKYSNLIVAKRHPVILLLDEVIHFDFVKISC